MGCGKSSVGRRLSELLCCRFVDLDEYIAAKEGRTIPEIFASEGESAFRQMESDALREIVTNTSDTLILSLGGGAVMTKDCAEMVREKTYCIYLRTAVETLVERLENEADGRPMLASGQNHCTPESRRSALRERIETLMNKRAATYETTAHHIIDTDGLSINNLAHTIISSIESNQNLRTL